MVVNADDTATPAVEGNVGDFNGALFECIAEGSTTDSTRSRSVQLHHYRHDGTVAHGRNDHRSAASLMSASRSTAKPEWLSGYSVELTPKNDGVTWGEIDWFEDLECASMTIRGKSDHS